MRFYLTRRAWQIAALPRRLFARFTTERPALPKGQATQRQLIAHLARIPNWQDKIFCFEGYEYSQAEGVWREKGTKLSEPSALGNRLATRDPVFHGEYTNVNYGCGGNLIEGWLNLDMFPADARNYRCVNLLDKHPFADEVVRFAFCEDVLEHLSQAESIFFLSEIHRTLVKGGVLRLSFPGLEGVLARHYSPVNEETVRRGEFEAYAFWDHIHFYSRDELILVARHIGFREPRFVEYGESKHAELAGRDTRSTQIGLNTYAELVK